ncbi:MAG: zinc metallopeptidase [Verrucomicrobiales bacterium]|nr:zinc metallopeptidase [Verrucomicrobiales bacterium]
MRWKGRRASDNVEDRRATSARGARTVGSGAGLQIFQLIASRFGIKGIVLAIIAGLFLWKLGIIDPIALLGGSSVQQPPAQQGQVELVQSEREKELAEFVSVVLGSTEEVWGGIFAQHNAKYQPPKLVLYRKFVRTACGGASSAMGPFYCPADQSVYIDLSFYDELESSFNAPGDFAQAYVLAHEVGHHVQHLLGTTKKVQARRGQPDGNQMSVRLELQADYYAGVWAYHSKEYLERGDIEEAMRAANAVGDDSIQKKSTGRVVPHAFTHGSSEQRMRWFLKGLESGDIEKGDTFSQPYDTL